MDIFVKNLIHVKAIARKFVKTHNYRYQVDELVNVAYIGYDRAITNNPELLKKFKKLGNFLFRVKAEMIDYIRTDTQFRRKKYKLNILTLPFQQGEHQDAAEEFWEPPCTRKDLSGTKRDVKELLLNTKLTNDEWFIIQQYFYDERTLKEIGQVIGGSESSISQKKTKICKKLLTSAERMCMI